MHRLLAIQGLLTILADACLACLLAFYTRSLPKRERSANRAILLPILVGFCLCTIIESLITMGLHGAMGGLIAITRFVLVASVVYSAMMLPSIVSSVRDESRNELVQKLETEFADRRKIEQELAHLASFAEQDPTAIIEMDRRGALRYVNPAAEQTFADLRAKGKTHAILEGLDPALFLMQQEGRNVLTRTVQVGDRIYRQQICLSETGSGVRIHMADVTELKRLEQIRSDLMARLPSELQSPLVSAQAGLQRILSALRPQLNREQEDDFLTALKQIGHLNRLAQELIENTQADTGHVEIRRQRVDIASLAKEVLGFMTSLAQEKGILLNIQSEPTSIEAFVDRDKLLTVFTEVLHQAVQSAAGKNVAIRLTASGSLLQCQVAAAGSAPLPEASRIPSALSRAIVQAHGGRLSFQDGPDGFQATMKLPILSVGDFFYERVRQLHEASVSQAEDFSLLRLYLPSWTALRHALGEEQAGTLWSQLLQIVSQTLRNEMDFAMQIRQSLWLALPGARTGDAQALADRIQALLREYAAKNLSMPIDLSVNIASYPKDGRAVESLLLLIGWFSESRPDPAPASPTVKV